MRASDWISRTPLAYRFVSIVCGVLAVVLVGRVLLAIDTLPETAFLGALAFALAFSAVQLSIMVQSYTLCVVFVLGSFAAYLDLISAEPGRPSLRRRIAFAVLSSLALLSHYFAGLYLVGCALGIPILWALDHRFRRAYFRAGPRRLVGDVLTFVPPALVAGLLYVLLARQWATSLNSMPQFYFRPELETISSFLVRNLKGTFNLFSPWELPRARLAFPALVLFLAATVWGARGPHGAPSSARRRMPSIMLLVLLVVGMAAGVLGRYPLGGTFSHQFLLFLFAVLAGFVAFDRLLRAVGSPVVRRVLIALCLLLIVAPLAPWRRSAAPSADRSFGTQVGAFRSRFPDPRLLHVDQFNLIGLVMQYSDWDWRYVGREPGSPVIERYEISRDDRRMTLLAHRDLWNFDFGNPELYRRLAASRLDADPRCVAVFCVHTNLYKPPERRLPDLDPDTAREEISRLASQAGLEASRVSILGNDVFAEFAGRRPRDLRRCRAGPARPRGWRWRRERRSRRRRDACPRRRDRGRGRACGTAPSRAPGAS